ncbi:MAG: matrixin family metalloprotease [Vicinamibacterales bacterium]
MTASARSIAWGLTCGLWALAAPAPAATVAYLTDADLIARADRIIRARVVDSRVVRDSGGVVRTHTELSVLEDLTGVAAPTAVLVELGDIRTMFVPGTPTLRTGEDIVVFLEAGRLGYRTINLSGSIWHTAAIPEVRGGETPLRRETDGVTWVGAPTRVETPPTLERLRELVAQRRHAVSWRPVGAGAAAPVDLETAAPEATAGFTLLGGGIRWFEPDRKFPIVWYRNSAAPAPTGTTGEAEIRLALSAWSAPPTAAIDAIYGGARAIGDASPFCSDANKGAGLVTFEDPTGELGSGVLAVGGGCVDPASTGQVNGTWFGAFSHAFVLVNRTALLAEAHRTSVNVARILEHEIGHGLGLGHANTASARAALNIMYPSCCLSSTPVPPALGPDDLAGIEFIYPTSFSARSCAFSVSPLAAAFPQRGGTASVVVQTAADCAWRIETSADWLHVAGPVERTGSATVAYDVDGNTGPSRSDVLRVADRTVEVSQESGDSDGDGLSDEWETSYGLDPRSTAGDDGGQGDPDGDGRSNADEQRLGSHPRGLFRRLFAEGAANAFFDSEISIFAPDESGPAHVLTSVLTADGDRRTLALVLPPLGRRDVRLGDFGLRDKEFAATIESDRPLAADRVMTWDARHYGAHADAGASHSSSHWYFAEGATHSGFELFYLLVNPNPIDADVRVRYLLPGPDAALERTYRVNANSRRTIWVDIEASALAATDVAAEIESPPNAPIVAERAMYRSGHRVFEAGHAAAGVTDPSLVWWFAEGATGLFFDTFILVANPSAAEAELLFTYALPDGSRLAVPHRVPKQSRATIWVDAESAALASTAAAVEVRSTNGVPVVVERAMWWPGPDATAWYEAHVNAGATELSARWALANADCGVIAPDQRTYLLVANPTARPGSVRVTLKEEASAAPVVKVLDLAATSRLTFDVCSTLPTPDPARVSVIVEAVDGQAWLVAERASYWSESGRFWGAGVASGGAAWP